MVASILKEKIQQRLNEKAEWNEDYEKAAGEWWQIQQDFINWYMKKYTDLNSKMSEYSKQLLQVAGKYMWRSSKWNLPINNLTYTQEKIDKLNECKALYLKYIKAFVSKWENDDPPAKDLKAANSYIKNLQQKYN